LIEANPIERRDGMRKSLSLNNRHRNIKVGNYALIWLFLDRYDPSGWVWGAVITICAILLLAEVVDLCTAKDVEL
jgi:hypothetical protein